MEDLIYDRTVEDVEYAVNNPNSSLFLKGAYNYTDLNRIEEWCSYLATNLTSMGYSISITTKIDWEMSDFPTNAEMERIRQNIRALMQGFTYITQIVGASNTVDYNRANNYEKILSEIYNLMYGTEQCYQYGGISYGNMPFLWNNRFIRKYNKTVELEYIESTGTQYIDTEVIPKTGYGFYIDFVPESEMTGTNASSFINAGGAGGSSSRRFVLSAFSEQGRSGEIQIFNIKKGAKLTQNVRCQVSVINNTITYPDGTTETISPNNYTASNSLLIGCAHNEPISRLSKMKLYNLKIYDGLDVIRDYIPVLYDYEPCLYDRVTETYLYNSGTGDFNWEVKTNE